MTWPDKLIEQLKELQAQQLSAGAIASKMGLTRSAVMGKLHRMGLSPVSQPAPNSVPRKPRRSSKPHNLIMASLAGQTAKTKSWSAIEAPSLSDADIPLAQRRGLIELQKHHCKYPVGDPQDPDFFFCGGARVEGKPYCAAHCRLAYRPEPARRGAVIPMRRAA